MEEIEDCSVQEIDFPFIVQTACGGVRQCCRTRLTPVHVQEILATCIKVFPRRFLHVLQFVRGEIARFAIDSEISDVQVSLMQEPKAEE